MSTLAERLTDIIDHERDRQVGFLAAIVRMPSDNPAGDCAPHAEATARLIEALGFTVERHAVPEELVRANGMVSATNLIVRHRFGDGPVVALNAHGDVVPPGEGWTHDPYGAEIVDGWMYGRGVAVSKSDFATYLWALIALKESGAALGGTVELHFTYDEEAGGEIGPGWLLREGLSRPDYALSAGFSYGVVNAHNGCLHLEVEVNGRSAHAAKPFTGIDALEAANHVLSALYSWRKGLAARISAIAGIGSPQMTVGLIRGGINTNVVPDRITFRLDRRMIPEENPVEVEAELRAVIAAAAQEFPEARVEVRRILLATPLTPTPASERLSETLCRHASAVMGETVKAVGVPLYTDARLYAAAGVPTVLYGAGPRSIEEANAHRADERLPLADLTRATKVVARTLAELLGAAPDA
ncbi:M20/M25/M40 family metallo-hydrolase [Ancylobacter polymorphus]|uniref:Acetylornithine deacetylase/succinyl-diaminopimelate desuccinylase-like protein n=1 Tax=Ancylobacter polymorphus TaxID=223390 RepID=A0ABU0BFX8_9HYPH|nr:M20/M25/M40 family metallo-hydrolase [Ancylobacter polymorphus]MDQ0303384.1 acetylornithine deacetylase/succinyl-diaminopimelate desuccinylase-like protein [Ancylobacter polymorphus]